MTMTVDFTLPSEVSWTVDELSILPDECRYELIDGRLDLWDCAPLTGLAGLALMSSLKLACPSGWRILPRVGLWPGGDVPPADIVVVGPGGDEDIKLVVDVVQPEWLFTEMLTRMRSYSALGVPAYWIFEHAEWIGAAMTAFCPAAGGGYEVGVSTREVFVADAPYPVRVDLPVLSNRWPQTFEYAERARVLRERS